MTIYEALITSLLARPGLTARIGNRLFPDMAPQGAMLPYVTMLDLGTDMYHTLAGQLPLEAPAVQFTVHAGTRAAARAVAAEIRETLTDYAGPMGGLTVQYIELLNELSGMGENTVDDSSDGTHPVYTTYLEFRVYYERS